MKIPFPKQLLVKNKAVRPIVGLWKRLNLKKFISYLFFKAKIANYNVTDRYFILIFIVHVPLIFLKGNNSVFNIRKNLEVSLLYGNKINKLICQQAVMPDNQNINFVAVHGLTCNIFGVERIKGKREKRLGVGLLPEFGSRVRVPENQRIRRMKSHQKVMGGILIGQPLQV